MLPGQRQDVSGRKGAQKNFSASEKNFPNRVIRVIVLSKRLLDSSGLNHLAQVSFCIWYKSPGRAERGRGATRPEGASPVLSTGIDTETLFGTCR